MRFWYLILALMAVPLLGAPSCFGSAPVLEDWDETVASCYPATGAAFANCSSPGLLVATGDNQYVAVTFTTRDQAIQEPEPVWGVVLDVRDWLLFEGEVTRVRGSELKPFRVRVWKGDSPTPPASEVSYKTFEVAMASWGFAKISFPTPYQETFTVAVDLPEGVNFGICQDEGPNERNPVHVCQGDACSRVTTWRPGIEIWGTARLNPETNVSEPTGYAEEETAERYLYGDNFVPAGPFTCGSQSTATKACGPDGWQSCTAGADGDVQCPGSGHPDPITVCFGTSEVPCPDGPWLTNGENMTAVWMCGPQEVGPTRYEPALTSVEHYTTVPPTESCPAGTRNIQRVNRNPAVPDECWSDQYYDSFLRYCAPLNPDPWADTTCAAAGQIPHLGCHEPRLLAAAPEENGDTLFIPLGDPDGVRAAPTTKIVIDHRDWRGNAMTGPAQFSLCGDFPVEVLTLGIPRGGTAPVFETLRYSAPYGQLLEMPLANVYDDALFVRYRFFADPVTGQTSCLGTCGDLQLVPGTAQWCHDADYCPDPDPSLPDFGCPDPKAGQCYDMATGSPPGDSPQPGFVGYSIGICDDSDPTCPGMFPWRP